MPRWTNLPEAQYAIHGETPCSYFFSFTGNKATVEELLKATSKCREALTLRTNKAANMWSNVKTVENYRALWELVKTADLWTKDCYEYIRNALCVEDVD